jgi:hypothetical protein
MATIDATDAKLSAHELVCAERYDVINARLKRLEGILISACGIMLSGMAATIFAMVTHIK